MAQRSLFPSARAEESANASSLIMNELNAIQEWLNRTVDAHLSPQQTLSPEDEDAIWVELSARLAATYVTRETLGHPMLHPTNKLVEKLHMWENAGLQPSSILERAMSGRLEEQLAADDADDDAYSDGDDDDPVVVIAHYEDGTTRVMHTFDDCETLDEDADYQGETDEEETSFDTAAVWASTQADLAARETDADADAAADDDDETDTCPDIFFK